MKVTRGIKRGFDVLLIRCQIHVDARFGMAQKAEIVCTPILSIIWRRGQIFASLHRLDDLADDRFGVTFEFQIPYL